MVYEWKSGWSYPVNPQVAGEMCEELEKNGQLTAKNLVNVNRPEDAPLHSLFEWDDEKAGEKYREIQARGIIRSIVVKKENVKEPVRQFLNITREDNRYHSIDVLMSAQDTRIATLKMALAELVAFKRKYSNFSEFAGVFTAIDQIRIDDIEVEKTSA